MRALLATGKSFSIDSRAMKTSAEHDAIVLIIIESTMNDRMPDSFREMRDHQSVYARHCG